MAFWLNVYNARLRSELADNPREGSLLRHRSLFKLSSYRVGEHDYSLDVIEHGLLRRNACPPYSARRLLSGSDPRLGAAPPELDPRARRWTACACSLRSSTGRSCRSRPRPRKGPRLSAGPLRGQGVRATCLG